MRGLFSKKLRFNLVDFYKEEITSVIPRPELLIQPGEMYSQAYDRLSSDSFYAETPLIVDDVVPINDPKPILVDNTDVDIIEEEIEVSVETNKIREQDTNDTVEEDLKKISHLPLGLSSIMKSDLIYEIDSAKIGNPEVLVKHKVSRRIF